MYDNCGYNSEMGLGLSDILDKLDAEDKETTVADLSPGEMCSSLDPYKQTFYQNRMDRDVCKKEKDTASLDVAKR